MPPLRTAPVTMGDTGTDVEDEAGDDVHAVEFPIPTMHALQRSVSNVSWNVPVVKDGELAVCLEAAVFLARARKVSQSEPCQQFLGSLLHECFDKLLNSNAVRGWTMDIHDKILELLGTFVTLFVEVLKNPGCTASVLGMAPAFAQVFNPECEFHKAVQYRLGVQPPGGTGFDPPHFIFLQKLIEHMGKQEGLEAIRACLKDGETGQAERMASVLKPFSHCFRFMAPDDVQRRI